MPRIEYRPKVFKQLKKIPKVEAKKIIRKLETLAMDPYSGKQLQGEYKSFLSIKTWPYRIIYTIGKKEIIVHSIRRRQGLYR